MGGITPLTRISGYGHVAVRYGLEEAVFLDAIMFWWRTNRDNDRNNYEGRWWTYNSVETYTDLFPWWSAAQIRRIIGRCKEKGALLAANFNEDKRDRTAWYSPSDELLSLYGENFVTCICQNQQMQNTERTNTSDDSSKCNNDTCNYHVGTNSIPPIIPQEGEGGAVDPDFSSSVPQTTAGSSPDNSATKAKVKKSRRRREWKATADHEPEIFEAFWTSYPRKDGRQEAIAAWDKLKPDKATIAAMARGLKAAKASEKWTKDGGRYIEYASTWINNFRWENQGVDQSQIVTAAPERSTGGWEEDRETYVADD